MRYDRLRLVLEEAQGSLKEHPAAKDPTSCAALRAERSTYIAGGRHMPSWQPYSTAINARGGGIVDWRVWIYQEEHRCV